MVKFLSIFHTFRFIGKKPMDNRVPVLRMSNIVRFYAVLSTYLPLMSKNILQTCRRIGQRQPIADLHLERIKCEGDSENSDVFRMSQGASSLNLRDCTLPVHVLTHLLDQLPNCTSLGKYS